MKAKLCGTLMASVICCLLFQPCAQPKAAEPVTTEPKAAEPVTTEPGAAKPVAAEPKASEPEAAKPRATEPGATEPVATKPEAAHSNTVKPKPSPFAPTGLLVRPDEDSGKILLRAHRLDVGAVILATAGYFRGVGGFPQNPFIAARWNIYLHSLNAPEPTYLLTLMLREKELITDKELAGNLAACAFALSGDLASRFKEAGLFDAKEFCQRLENGKKAVPEWEKEYRDTVELVKRVARRRDDAIHAARAFRDNPCSDDLRNDLHAGYGVASADALAFYAATTHNPAKETPDWGPERLLRFLDKLNICEQREKKESGTASPLFGTLATAARDALVRGLSEDGGKALYTIRTAHNIRSRENLEAVRDMAVHYRGGSPGFVKDDQLARLWLQHAAFKFDNASRLVLALEWFSEQRYAEAWAWATVIGKDKDTDEKTRWLAARIVEMCEARAGKDIRNRGVQYERFYFHATGAWINWLREQRQRKEK